MTQPMDGPMDGPMNGPMNGPMKRRLQQLGKPRASLTRRGQTALVVMVVTVALGALRCSVDVPLGVDPRSDAADNTVDAGSGN